MRTLSVDFNTGGFERTPKIGNKWHGLSEKIMSSTLSLTIAHMADVTTKDLNNYKDATIKVSTDTGVTWVVSGASTVSPATISGDEGEMTFEMAGPPAKEA
jgi:hypothetical protein